MRHYNFSSSVPSGPRRKLSTNSVGRVVGSVVSVNEGGRMELGSLSRDGYFVARATFIPGVSSREANEFIYLTLNAHSQ